MSIASLDCLVYFGLPLAATLTLLCSYVNPLHIALSFLTDNFQNCVWL